MPDHGTAKFASTEGTSFQKPVDKQYLLQYTSRNATFVSLTVNNLKRMMGCAEKAEQQTRFAQGQQGEILMKRIFVLGALTAFLCAGQFGLAQTANTGALVGTVTDASGAVVPGAQVVATNHATGQAIAVASNARGYYQVPLLPPGNYAVNATKAGFKASDYDRVTVKVTETSTLNVTLQVGAVSQKVVVNSNAEQLDTTDAQLGNVIDSRYISTLPLAARNYLQIIGLNPGVSTELTDAGDLGRGASSLASGGSGFSTNGASTIDNNFQMNGVPVNDNLANGEFSGGIPIPNPDTLQEFNVVTGPYDASYGRDAGANVDVLTKTGSNDFHASLFEFFRNNDMNANLWFLNHDNQPRAVLKQNQFGGTIGGHIKRNKIFYFGSYQGTRQRNGISDGCAVTVQLPPLTNDRSAAALGAIFAGQRGVFQDALGGVGPAIAANGSNINPVALAVLQRKLPDGSYMVPTPQTIDTSAPSFDAEGSASFSVPCPFTENQYMANGDYVHERQEQHSTPLLHGQQHIRADPGAAKSARKCSSWLSLFECIEFQECLSQPHLYLQSERGEPATARLQPKLCNQHAGRAILLVRYRLDRACFRQRCSRNWSFQHWPGWRGAEYDLRAEHIFCAGFTSVDSRTA